MEKQNRMSCWCKQILKKCKIWISFRLFQLWKKVDIKDITVHLIFTTEGRKIIDMLQNIWDRNFSQSYKSNPSPASSSRSMDFLPIPCEKNWWRTRCPNMSFHCKTIGKKYNNITDYYGSAAGPDGVLGEMMPHNNVYNIDRE